MKETNVIEVLNRLINNIRYTKILYSYEVKLKNSKEATPLNII